MQIDIFIIVSRTNICYELMGFGKIFQGIQVVRKNFQEQEVSKLDSAIFYETLLEGIPCGALVLSQIVHQYRHQFCELK